MPDPILYAHPFSSYCQKVLIACYENDIAFAYRRLGDDPSAWAELAALWPIRKFPLLVDGETIVAEASTIIDYLQWRHPGPVQLVPDDPAAAIEVRMLDRIFDNYVMTPMQRIVAAHAAAPGAPDATIVGEAAAMLDTSYGWLDARIAGRAWAAGEAFSLADCAAAPALFYADWVHPIGADRPALRAYRARLLERPSFARAVEEARPFRGLFPPGAPPRD